LPAAHGEQVEAEVAPSSAEYLPAAHVLQVEEPSSAEYLPAKPPAPRQPTPQRSHTLRVP